MEKLQIRSSANIMHNTITCICGHCNNTISLNAFAEYSRQVNETIPSTTKTIVKSTKEFITGQCPYCGKPIIYQVDNGRVLPPVSNFENIPFLPKDIEILYKECKTAFSVGAYTCCVITTRTLMANIAVEQGDTPGKGFVDYVTYLQNNCLPPKTNNAWVDKIRRLGNDSTHKLKIATKEDAELAIKFIIAILRNVYDFPNA